MSIEIQGAESDIWGWEFYWCALNYTKDYQSIPLYPKHLDCSIWFLGQHSPTAATCVQPPHGDPSEIQAGTGTPVVPHICPPPMSTDLQSALSSVLLCLSSIHGPCSLYSRPKIQSRKAKLNISPPDILLLLGAIKRTITTFHIYVSRACVENISWPYIASVTFFGGGGHCFPKS